jgi:hypothetical protein
MERQSTSEVIRRNASALSVFAERPSGVMWLGDAGMQWRGFEVHRRVRACAGQRVLSRGGAVDEEVFNMSVRKFLKTLGVTAQREIELAVREQLEGGDLRGDETLDATATVTVAGLSRDVVVTGKISLS